MARKTNLPTLLAIGGMSRSGTTLLVQLLNTHPDVRITHEMKIFLKIGEKRAAYWQSLPKIIDGRHHLLRCSIIISKLHLFTYYLLTLIYWKRPITLSRIQRILSWLWRDRQVVGDKYPRYWYHLPKLIEHSDSLKIIMIYRDGRDVSASFMQKVRTDWANSEWAQKVQSAEEVALRWQDSIHIMQAHQDHIFLIRYEDLIQTPQLVLKQMGDYLGVDGTQFDHTLIKSESVGKYKLSLTPEEIQAIESQIGKTLHSLGYEV